MPGEYVPVGIQATVARGNAEMTGWIEGPGCGVVSVRRTVAAAPTDSLYGGYGRQWWKAVTEMPEGTLFVDDRDRPVIGGGNTQRLWVRWEVADDGPPQPLQPGQALEWEMEFDCEAALVRTWYTLLYAPDGQMQHADAPAPYRWAEIQEGTFDELAWQQACSGATE